MNPLVRNIKKTNLMGHNEIRKEAFRVHLVVHGKVFILSAFEIINFVQDKDLLRGF